MPGTAIFNEQFPISFAHEFLAADGTTEVGVYVQGSYGCRYDTAYCRNEDVIDHDVVLVFQSGTGGTARLTVLVPAGAGVGAVPPVEMFSKLFGAQQSGQAFAQADSFAIGMAVAVTAAFTVRVWLSGGQL